MAMPATSSTAAAYDWRPIAPADAGFTPDLEARLDKLIADKRAWNLHGVVVVRNDRLVLERYFEGEDEARGRSLGKIAFSRGDAARHALGLQKRGEPALRHCAGTGQGAAARRRRCWPRSPLMPTSRRAGRERLTIHHALTMTMGTEWDELSIPYTNPANSEIAMDRAADRYRFILERRVIEEPGRRWIYSGGATALLARIIADGTGKPLHSLRARPCSIPSGSAPRRGTRMPRARPLPPRACA